MYICLIDVHPLHFKFIPVLFYFTSRSPHIRFLLFFCFLYTAVDLRHTANHVAGGGYTFSDFFNQYPGLHEKLRVSFQEAITQSFGGRMSPSLLPLLLLLCRLRPPETAGAAMGATCALSGAPPGNCDGGDGKRPSSVNMYALNHRHRRRHHPPPF
jgi:hypothetical protein